VSCESETAKALRTIGQKVTPQRMLVLCAVRHRKTHVTAGDVLAEVRRSLPYIDVSTVYRTLNSAKELRLISEVSRAGEDNEYEWIGADRHHHLICRSCGAEQLLDNSYLDSLAAALLEEHGFQADLDHFAISGLCRACRASEDAARRTSPIAEGERP
jgi:Fur family ferric uptake transcriptional regulator